MPLFYQHNINEFSRLGIWKIEEEESFFMEKVFLQRQISHPHKRLQHLAGRYLLQFLFSDFPYELIMIADTRQPLLSNQAYHFSISHCGDYAAAIVSKTSRVGVDIELVKPMIRKVMHKFLSDQELSLLTDNHQTPDESNFDNVSSQLLTLGWSSKEALFKWYGEGGVDFKSHMQLNAGIDFDTGGVIRSSYVFSKNERILLPVISRFFDDLVLSYIISNDGFD